MLEAWGLLFSLFLISDIFNCPRKVGFHWPKRFQLKSKIFKVVLVSRASANLRPPLYLNLFQCRSNTLRLFYSNSRKWAILSAAMSERLLFARLSSINIRGFSLRIKFYINMVTKESVMFEFSSLITLRSIFSLPNLSMLLMCSIEFNPNLLFDMLSSWMFLLIPCKIL